MANKRKFEFLEDIATADAAFVAYGADLAELLQNAATALFAVMAEPGLVGNDVTRRLKVTGADREELLYNWLAELVYLKDVRSELYNSFEISLVGDTPIRLSAVVKGTPITNLKEQTGCDVKAVTYHRLVIEESDGGLKATVVLDI